MPLATMRFAEFWPALKTRLNSATMQSILGGADRVYMGWEDHDQPEGSDDRPWGRVILAVGETLWPRLEIGNALHTVRFRVVIEINDFVPADGSVWNPLILLEAGQHEAYQRLQHWAPTGLARLKMGMAVAREEWPSPQPLWDETRHVWWNSSLYRFEAVPVAV